MCRAVAYVSLLLLPALARAEIKLDHVRATYGRSGPTRTDLRVVPGENLQFEYAVSGLMLTEDGNVVLGVSYELFDADAKRIAGDKPRTVTQSLALGGGVFVDDISVSLPLDFKAGKYKVRAVVKDVLAKKEVDFEREFEVIPLEFALVRLRLSADPKGEIPAGPNFSVHQVAHVHGVALGFARKGKNIHVAGQLRVKDPDGKDMMVEPIKIKIDQDAPDDAISLDVHWHLALNRIGKFTFQVEMTDENAGKTVKYALPIQVHPEPSMKNDKNEK
jgi:hypothetical protein